MNDSTDSTVAEGAVRNRILRTLRSLTKPKARLFREPLNQLQTKAIVHSAVTDSTVSTAAEGAVDSVADTDY